MSAKLLGISVYTSVQVDTLLQLVNGLRFERKSVIDSLDFAS